MCLILFAWRAHPDYPLIFAGNRDEAYDRPSVAADFWSDAPGIYGGRDLEKGGTWLGLTLSGRFAAVTNYRDGPARKPAPLSRGELAGAFLRGTDAPDDYLSAVAPDGARYGGYSLMLGTLDGLYYHSNRSRGVEEIAPGPHGLSNHLLDTPWPKIRLGKQRLAALLNASEAKLVDGLFAALADRTPAADADLPDSGIGLQRERELSPAFIAGERYGTRASTVVLIDHRNEATFIERSFGPQGRTQAPEIRRRFVLQMCASGRKTKATGQDV
jgi:uncharacterized protein with NRDE domain